MQDNTSKEVLDEKKKEFWNAFKQNASDQPAATAAVQLAAAPKSGSRKRPTAAPKSGSKKRPAAAPPQSAKTHGKDDSIDEVQSSDNEDDDNEDGDNEHADDIPDLCDFMPPGDML